MKRTATLQEEPERDETAVQDALPLASYRHAARLLRPHVGARRARIVLAILISLGASGCAMVPPLAIGALVDALAADPTLTEVLVAVAVMLLGLLGAALLGWWGRIQWAKIAEPAVAGLREDVVAHALELEPGAAGAGGRGDLVARVSDDARIVAGAVADLLPTIVGAATLLVLSLPALFTLHWVLGLVVLVAVPLYVGSLRWYLPRSEPLYELERERLGARTGRLLGALQGQAALRAHGWSEAEQVRIEAASAQSRDAGIAVFRMLTGFYARNNRAECVVMVLLLATGFVLVGSGVSTVGTVTAAALLFHRLFDPISAVVVLFDVVQEAGIALRRLTGVLTLPAPRGTLSLETAPAALEVDVAAHTYRGGIPALGEVRLTLRAGESVALVGTTGAGKSTLASIAAGTLRASRGGAWVRTGAGRVGAASGSGAGPGSGPAPGPADRVELGELSPAALRRSVCLVEQKAHVFAGTLRQNLLLGVPEERRTEQLCAEALERAGIDWVGDWEAGLDHVVGAGGSSLSAVQQQQLALARIMLIDPAFVVLDEATAEAGSVGARALDAAALESIRGRGALVVAHRLSQARQADRIVVMERGRIVEEGPHDRLVLAGGPYARLWEAWSGR